MEKDSIKTIKQVLKAYKKADSIARNEMWIRYDGLRKIFAEIDHRSDTKWRGPGIVPWAVWARKEKRL